MRYSNTPKVYGLYDPRSPDDIKYVGKTIHSLNYRLNQHKRNLYNITIDKKLTYKERWITKLIREGVQPGIKLLEECATEELAYEQEVVWIQNLIKQGHKLTNTAKGGRGGSAYTGRIVTEETRQKISKTLTGRPLPEETKRKMSETIRGVPRKPLSEETKRKISEARKGKTFNHSEETRRKISEANKGQASWSKGKKLGPKSESTKKKLSEAHIGRALSEEHKRKISEGLKQRFSTIPYSRNK